MNEPLAKVAIIGGGFSGSMLALHLIRKIQTSLEIFIIEPRSLLGKGLAYSTTCSAHLLNVPAAGMSAFPDDSEHFLRYAKNRDSSVQDTTFVPRKIYGEYISSLINETMGSQGKCTVSHVQDSVESITRDGKQFLVTLAGGSTISADIVVLATGNLSGKRPKYCENLSSNESKYLHDPWTTGAIASIAPNEDVLLVGTGLTSVDKMIELDVNKHQGKIYAASRHGLLPRPHVDRFVGKKTIAQAQMGSVQNALRSLREQVSANKNGDDESWRLVFDGLRAQTQDWWLSLSTMERRKFHRHLRTYFDVHRHRMASTIADNVDKLILKSQLTILAARIESVTASDGRLKVVLKERGKQQPKTIFVDRIINCTGPQSGIFSTESQLLKQLVENKLAVLSDPPFDIEITRDGRVVSPSGDRNQGLFAIGPLLKGTLLESVAVPELRGQAEMVANEIAEALSCSRVS